MASFYIPRIHKSWTPETIRDFLNARFEEMEVNAKFGRIDLVEDKTNRHFVKAFVYSNMNESDIPDDFEGYTLYLPETYGATQSVYWKLYKNQNPLSNKEKEIADSIGEIEEHMIQMMYELAERDIPIPKGIELPELNENKENAQTNKLNVLLEKEKEMNKMRIKLMNYAQKEKIYMASSLS